MLIVQKLALLCFCFAFEYLEERWFDPFQKPLMQEHLAGGTALGRVVGAWRVADVQNLFRTS